MFSTIKLVAMGVGLLALVGAWYGVKRHYENIGYEKALSHVESANKGAIDARDKAVLPVKECYDAGRDWDVVRGVCLEQ